MASVKTHGKSLCKRIGAERKTPKCFCTSLQVGLRLRTIEYLLSHKNVRYWDMNVGVYAPINNSENRYA